MDVRSYEDTKGSSEAINRRRTDNAVAKRKRIKQTPYNDVHNTSKKTKD